MIWGLALCQQEPRQQCPVRNAHERGNAVKSDVGTELDATGTVNSPVGRSLANLAPAELLVVAVVPLVDLVSDTSKLLLVRLEKPSFSHIVWHPK